MLQNLLSDTQKAFVALQARRERVAEASQGLWAENSRRQCILRRCDLGRAYFACNAVAQVAGSTSTPVGVRASTWVTTGSLPLAGA